MAHIDNAKRIHLIGIGGCSMNGLALILKSQGHEVTGSDREATQFTGSLDEAGIRWSAGHTGEYLKDADLVIYSAAIKPENPERVMAKELGIPELERSVALGQISARYKDVVAVAGCHGKTTITSMLAYVNKAAGTDATVHVGGYVDLLGGGVRVGHDECFITEACEYVESFLTLAPTVAIINNIDDDHLDYYKDIDHIVMAFEKFLKLLPENGLFIANTDDARVAKLAAEQNGRVRVKTFGLKSGSYSATDIVYDESGFPAFTLTKDGAAVGRVQLSVPGEHNVQNAIACWIVAEEFGIPFETYAEAMNAFQNTRRRFEFFGERSGIRYYHDYAHHPGEIRATVNAASRVPHKHLYCVFQCNSYTRARTLFCENVTCFAAADKVLVPDIYPGREVDTGIVHAKDMVAGINAATGNALYLGTFEAIREWLDANGEEGDLVVTLGSGDVFRQTKKLL